MNCFDQAVFAQADERSLTIAAKVKEVADGMGHRAACGIKWRSLGKLPATFQGKREA